MTQNRVAQEILKVRGSLFGFLYSLVRDLGLAEELFQEVCARILERADRYVPGTDFGAWARAFARAVVFEHQRWRQRVLISDGAIAAAEEHFGRLEDEYFPRREALRKCMKELGAESRQLVEMRFEKGLSMKEIGERLKRSGGAVQVALSRIRGWLMKCILNRLQAEAGA
jgi:RNA polymerase sigma-70 factor (ECF subfamily)